MDDVNRNGWLKRKEGVIKAKKQTESETLDHWHARGGVLLSNDWLEKQKKKDLFTKWDVCDALVVSRPEKIVHKIIQLTSNLGWN